MRRKIEFEYLRKAIGKEVTVNYPHSYQDITGKLIDVNETNLTLILECDDGIIRIIPFKGKHIYSITVYGKIKLNHHVRNANKRL